MDDLALWNLMREAWSNLAPYYEPVIARIVSESGVDGRGWGLLIAAFTFEPDETTPAHLMVRGPYTAAENYLARLRRIAGSGYLGETREGAFRLTPEGRLATDRFIKQLRGAMADADPLPRADSLRLASLLNRLVHASLETPSPPNNWSINLSYKLMPIVEPPLPFIEQAFSCLAAYRDDAHLAAWRQSSLTATSLEALTLLWREEADSLAGLVEKLAHRGHPLKIYENSLRLLRSRKYLTGTKRRLKLTDEGKRFQEEVETETDRYFFAPWDCLNDGERAEIEGLLVILRDGLKAGAVKKS